MKKTRSLEGRGQTRKQQRCPRCGVAFTPARPHQVKQYFCSPRCRVQANAERQRRRQTVGLMIHLGDA